MRAHVQAIPFENVDVILGQHQGISLDVVSAKLIGRRRGGYCYEQNGLFAAVLERLGYRVHRLAARVQPRRPGPATHMTVVAEVDGQRFLADVGYGVGRELTVEKPDGSKETTAVAPDELDATLKDLGIELTPDELARLLTVY